MSLGPAEILVIFVIALMVFGPNRLPEIGRQVGRGVRELRRFQQTLKHDLDDVLAEDVSDRAKPAPQLPPLAAPAPPPPGEGEAAPVEEADGAPSSPDVLDANPPSSPPPDPT